VEDQLIKTVETFPEILQVFNIGLNAGLNSYLAFEFAQNAIKGEAPKILVEEINRTRYAMKYGEEHTKTWERLAHRLPFETIVDFAEIMILAPMHGESIVNAITQMTSGYQEKKLLLVEKKATAISQIVVPIIILAFLPLFLFVMFAPLITKIKLLIQS
jgi:Flp pilus assembly protein TadB